MTEKHANSRRSARPRRRLRGLAVSAVALMASVSPVAVADDTAHANSKNWFVYKYYDQNSGSTDYSFASSALKATFSYEAQAWNEGGTSGQQTWGPDSKFKNVAGAPAAKSWPIAIGAKVPAPGTTEAEASFVGDTYVDTGFFGTIFLMRYWASYAAFAEVKKATIPAGGFGRALATVKDPWSVDVPIANPGDLVEVHAFLELTGSDLTTTDPTSTGELNWHVSLDGVSEFQSYLFDYTATDLGLTFTSSMLVAPGVRLFLNDFGDWTDGGDWTDNLEFDPSTEVTVGQLKTYLDGFETAGGGWSLGSTPVLIGLQFAIPNSDLGVGSDPAMREFLLHNDASSELMASVPVPEPGTIGLAALAFLALGVLARRHQQEV